MGLLYSKGQMPGYLASEISSKLYSIAASNMRIVFCLLLVLPILCDSSVGFASDAADDPKTKANGLVLKQSQHVEIELNEAGQLEIMAHIYEETQHFSENANLYREQSISYSNTFTEISNLKAYSMIPSGKNKFKKIPVKEFITSDARSAGIFYDDQKKISYVFPALSEGAKTIFSYSKKYREPRLWGYFMFSSYFPVKQSEFKVKVPEGVELNYSTFGIDEEDFDFSISKKGKYNLYRWLAKDLEKIELSKGADGVLHSAPHLIIHVDSYKHNGVTHQVLGEVKDLHAWYQNFLDGIKDDSEEMQTMVSNILEGKSTELEKVEAIYDWVQKNVKYIAIEDGLGGFRPRSSNTVFTRRYGDCKDMSNLIHNMLDIANIPSNLAWIGTTAIPYSHQEVPTPMADNHMICTYTNNGRYYFLDATDPHNRLGVPTTHIQGQEALINKGINDFELVDVPVVPFEENRVADSTFLSFENGKLTGTGRVKYSGYSRTPVANNLENLDRDDKKTFLNLLLKKGNNKFMLDSVTTHHIEDKNSDLVIDYDFSIQDYVISTSDEIFINPHLKRELSNDLIDISTTQQDVHYSYKRMISNVYSIDLPKDYSVSFLPENTKFEDEEFGFEMKYIKFDDRVDVHQEIRINTLLVKTNKFESWNKMVKALFSAYKESIVLGRE